MKSRASLRLQKSAYKCCVFFNVISTNLIQDFHVTYLLIVFFNSVVKLEPQENEPFYDVIAIVDPLTREAQKMAHLLIVRWWSFLLICTSYFHVRWQAEFKYF